MSESTVSPQQDKSTADAPRFNPDDELMADLEGSKSAVKAYRRESNALREVATSK